MNFPRYNLSAKQIRGLANIVQHEQGTKAGMYAEASLMANLTDIAGDQNATVERLIKKATGGWFAYGLKRYNAGYNGTVKVSQVAIDAVVNSIQFGRRVLPRFINEHDCLGDIKSVTNGTKNNKAAWKPHTTIIKNRYGSTWCFYSFPGGVKTGVDPFGYTSVTMRKKWGDECYTLAEAEKGDEYMGYYKGTLHDPAVVGLIKKGAKGNHVKEVQAFLNSFFRSKLLELDGVCGDITCAYIYKFQKQMGLTADRIWGHKTYVKAKNATLKDAFIAHMYIYHDYVVEHGKYFVRDATPDKPFSSVLEKVSKGKKTKICCNAPDRWAFHDFGFNPYDIWAKNGTFKSKFTGTMTKHLKRITSGKPIGMTVKQAIDGKYLKAGDICCFKDLTHTLTYSGSGYLFFDGGEAAEQRGYQKTGILLDYTKVNFYKNKKISEILRWK